MKTVCKLNDCTGCMACVDACPKTAITIRDDLSAYNAVINEGLCSNCGSCFRVCQNNRTSVTRIPIKWHQGWATEANVRVNGSSGGVTSAIASEFIESGGTVYSCVFENGDFVFCATDIITELYRYAGSKYVKSNPSGIYNNVLTKLKKGQKVLFIALPCQVAALKNYIDVSLHENLYTVDMICHGTPSPKMLDLFIKQYGYCLDKVSSITFRRKEKFQIIVENKEIETPGKCDKYSIAFLNSLFYTENCYNCKFASLSRTSDITVGDSWGNTLSKDQQKKGVSLILVQTEKGLKMLEESKISLLSVNIENAIKNNHQLIAPSVKPKNRDSFFKGISENRNFNRLVYLSFPYISMKQDIKEVLLRAKLYR